MLIKLDNCMQRNANKSLSCFTELNFKGIKGLNVRSNTLNLTEEVGNRLELIYTGKDFLNKMLAAQANN